MDTLRHLHAAHTAAGNSSDDGYTVNLPAYERYLNKHYPNLHTPEFGDLQHASKDNVLRNPIDIAMYKGMNSPDDVWDSLARSLYGMGYLGVYAKTAAMLESGRNYLFTFTEFAHVYPCLRSMHGDAFKLKNMLDVDAGDVEVGDSDSPAPEKSLKEFYHQLYKRGRHYEMFSRNINHNEIDVNLERRSVFNESLVYSDHDENPRGTLWTYLTVNKEEVDYDGDFRWGFGEKSVSKRLHDQKRYVYEKFVFCTARTCPAIMRIILDCIHNVVIISMVNPHFDCWETHKRRVFDVVRKLVVLHGADLNYIDTKYLSIPRRFGLTYVESWINSEEFIKHKQSGHTPSYFCYSYKDKSDSWSQTKSRSWLSDIYHDHNETASLKREREIEKEASPLIESDKRVYAIREWKSSPIRTDEIGNLIYRSEYEYHLEQFISEKLREIYRVWRIMYFETTDKMRTVTKLYNGSMITMSQLYFSFTGYNNNIHFSTQLPPKYWEQVTAQLAKRYIHLGTIILCSFLNLYKKPVVDPAIFIPSYPSNKRLKGISELSNEKMIDDGKYVIINATLEELANSDDIYITQRYSNFGFANYDKNYLKKRSGLRRNWANFYCHFLEKRIGYDSVFTSNRIFDDFFDKKLGLYDHFFNSRNERILRYLDLFYAKYGMGIDGYMISKLKPYYKLSHVKFFKGDKVHDAFIIHPKLLHETTFINDLVNMREPAKSVSKLTIMEFPSDSTKEFENYLPIFSTERRKKTAGLYETIKNASPKIAIDVIIVKPSEILPIEILNTVYGICVTNNRQPPVTESMTQNLNSRFPPMRFTDLQPFYLSIDGTVICSTTALARAKLNSVKKMVADVIREENRDPSCEPIEGGHGFVLHNDLIKRSIGDYLIIRSSKIYKEDDCARIWKFIDLFNHDHKSKKFESFFQEISISYKERPKDMIEMIERISRKMMANPS